MNMLADSPLPATSPIMKNRRFGVETKKIVEIAADFARRGHRRGEVDARFVAQRFRARQDAGLDALCRLQLAGDVRRLHALRLHDVLERFPAPCRVAQASAPAAR